MMERLKKRQTAVVIAVLVVALATLFGAHRSLAAAVGAVEDQFYNGAWDEAQGYRQPSIYSQLEKRVEASLGFLTIADSFDDLQSETEALRQARFDLTEAMDDKAITRMYTANEDLQSACETLYGLLTGKSLTEEQTASLERFAATMSGAQSVIRDSVYNAAVSTFLRDTLLEFPANILKNLTFVKSPEFFGLEG